MNLLELPWQQYDKEGRAVFVYDLDELRAQSRRVQSYLKQFSSRTEIAFSLKSNPHPKIIQCLMNEISGFDVSSELELKLCQRLGIAGSRISVSGPGKTDACLKLAQEMKIQVLQVDSIDEVRAALQAGHKNFSFRIHANDIFSTKLGMNDQEISQALNMLPEKALGLHLYLGRESFSWSRLKEVRESMLRWFQKKPDAFINDPQLFIGPGIPGQWDLDAAPEAPTNRPTTFELGRGLVASCGSYAAPVLSRKLLDRGGEALIIHGGLQHLGSPFVTFAQKVHELKAQVIRQGRMLETEDTQEFLVAGSLCLGHDILHPRLKQPRQIQRGDWIVFPQAGAYGLSAGVPFFIGQDLPSEVIFENGSLTESTLKDFRLYQDCF